jgi:glucosamine--fructose-6-phosphate aminotransferase (isomerizing)
LAEVFADKEHALYLGRGSFYPIAMEGALKLKELSYIMPKATPQVNSSMAHWHW